MQNSDILEKLERFILLARAEGFRETEKVLQDILETWDQSDGPEVDESASVSFRAAIRTV